jgi:PAS domain S-box-containing protein
MSGQGRSLAAAQGDMILESIAEGVFTIDHEFRITSFNRAAERITGTPRAEAIGRPCHEVLRSSMCDNGCAMRQTLASGKTVVGRSGYITGVGGDRIPVSVATALLHGVTGEAVGGAGSFRDLSALDSIPPRKVRQARVGDLTSCSPTMQQVLAILPTLAASASTVLILGETGTGKELLARKLHELSPRSRGPFVAVNCGALPDTLLESELFGYRAGAFTGATRNKPGRFAAARGGTIFLDEIGEISAALQIRLLRVLQERSYEPLGSVVPERADVRVLAATNRNLDDEMHEGRFREDLFYRINVVRLDIPPLRERKEDVPQLVSHFVARFNRRQERSVSGIVPEAISLLMAHDWPGNVRELENVIEGAFVLCGDGPIELEHLPRKLRSRIQAEDHNLDIRDARAAIDAQKVRDALARCQGSRIRAARELGIHKSTLFRLIKRLDITPPTIDGRSRPETDE